MPFVFAKRHSSVYFHAFRVHQRITLSSYSRSNILCCTKINCIFWIALSLYIECNDVFFSLPYLMKFVFPCAVFSCNYNELCTAIHFTLRHFSPTLFNSDQHLCLCVFRLSTCRLLYTLLFLDVSWKMKTFNSDAACLFQSEGQTQIQSLGKCFSFSF